MTRKKIFDIDKLSKEKINCRLCGNISHKYHQRNFRKERIFCSQRCRIIGNKSNFMLGEKNSSWKGDNAKYCAKHQWINKNYGKANKCENKDCLKESKIFDWANISGEYKRDIKDYKMLCRSCHGKFDKWHLKRNRGSDGKFI
jgi:hypothetical protein